MTKPSRRWAGATLGAVAGLVLLIASAYVAGAWWMSTRMPAGTIVAGIDVGGMDAGRASAAVAAWASAREQEPIELAAPAILDPLVARDAGLGIDVDATMGLVPSFGWAPPDLAAWLMARIHVEPVVTVDEARLDAGIRELADAVARPPVEPVLRFEGTAPVLVPGRDGQALDTELLRAGVLAAFPTAEVPVNLPLRPEAPSVPADEAHRAWQDASRLISEPLTITAGDGQARVTRRQLARSVSFRTADGTISAVVDGARLKAELVARHPDLQVPGRDATFRIRAGVPVVVEGSPGTTLDEAGLAAAVEAAFLNYPSSGSVTVPLAALEPDLTADEARALGITARLSRFTQAFPYAPYRVQNIGRAADFIDGTILLPGQTFSLNQTIKERTRENGYTEGIVIGPGGVFREDLGGGVSAAATTTWTAAFFAGMERVETRAHSIYISRYQPGLEATVAWGVFDMRFRNDSPYAVLLKARTTNTSMTVSFWGTRIYDEIKAEFGPRTDIVPFDTITDTSPQCLGQSGVSGFDITVDRVFYVAGAEVRREPIHTEYRPAPRVVCGST
ncbi:MAG: VanW family protein [Actinomycetota bacterium]|nr:VanW family protein [Actinomycetota bacterium]